MKKLFVINNYLRKLQGIKPSLGDYIASRKELEEVSGNLFQMIVKGKITIDIKIKELVKIPLIKTIVNKEELSSISFTANLTIVSFKAKKRAAKIIKSRPLKLLFTIILSLYL